MHLNTVLLPVAWETIEPEEGKFDFNCVDGLLEGARENHLELIVLWFGAWKNTYSGYVPAWVKTNTERFPRVQTSDGRDTAGHVDESAIGDLYAVLSKLAPTILKQQEAGSITATLIEGEEQRSARAYISDYIATITRTGSASAASSRVGVMFIPTDANEFLIVSSGDAQVTFSTDSPGPPIVGIESIDEELYEQGAWVQGRRLNGDESSHGQVLRLHSSDLSKGRIFRVRLYRYR
jgi:hypothetical protein